MVPKPISLQLSPILRLKATFDPGSTQIGFFKVTSTISSRAELTIPDVTSVPAFRTRGSFILTFRTGTNNSVPTAFSKSFTSNGTLSNVGGNEPVFPTTLPTSPSDFVTDGSRLVPIATSPPG